MIKYKLLLVFALILTFAFTQKALAAFTISANSITGDVPSAIDMGVGNALSLQGTNNGAVTTGTGLFTAGGSLAVGARMALQGGAIQPNTIIDITNAAYVQTGTANAIRVSLTSSQNFILRGQTISLTQNGNADSNGLVINITSSGTNSGVNSINSTTQINGSTFIAQGASIAVFALGSASVTTMDLIKPGFLGASGGAVGTLNGLSISGWLSSGTVTESRGIFLDNSIDVGATRYAILSRSTSQSRLVGNLKLGADTAPSQVLDVTGNAVISGTIQTGGNLTLGPATSHVISSQTTPPAPSVTGSGYSGASVGAGSTDTKGTITATVGAAVGTLVVTFQTAYASAPVCTVSPGTATSQVDVGKVYVTTATGALTLNFVATPTGGSETWNYICLQ